MYRYLPIRRICAREVLDSRGNPTVEVEVTVGEGIIGIDGYTDAPSYPPVRPQENLRRWSCGTARNATAVWVFRRRWKNVNTRLAERLVGENALNQAYIGPASDGGGRDSNKGALGANAILGVSLAVARAGAKRCGFPFISTWRRTLQADAGTHDEYFKRRMPCGQYGGSSGIYDYAGGSLLFFGRPADVRGNLPLPEKDPEGEGTFPPQWETRAASRRIWPMLPRFLP